MGGPIYVSIGVRFGVRLDVPARRVGPTHIMYGLEYRLDVPTAGQAGV